MAVGASTWASGSQVWNGNTGTLIANPRNSARKTIIWNLGANGCAALRVTMSNVCGSVEKYIASMASRIATLPRRVYRKNLMAAYSRLGPPQIPIRKYIGTSIASQNT